MYYSMRAQKCQKGQFKIDLTGTPVEIDPSVMWSWRGMMNNSLPNTNDITISSCKTLVKAKTTIVSISLSRSSSSNRYGEVRRLPRRMFPGLVVGENGAETSSSRRSHAHVRRSEHGQSVQELRQVRVDRRESVAMQLPAGMVGRDVRHDDRYEEISSLSLSLSLLNLHVTSSSDYC